MMLRQIMLEPGKIVFSEVPIPKVQDGEVLVKIRSIGICGSDIHVYHGKHPFTSYPVTQGHEVSGEVAELGSGVTGFKLGDKVTIQPQVVCGTCYLCRNGRYNLCENLKVMGFQTTGAASEFFAVDQKKLLKLPDNMSFELGAMIEPLAVAVHAAQKAGDMKGKNIVVLGAGPIGNLVAQVAIALGAKDVIVTDLSDYRLEKAKECGVKHTVNVGREDLEAKILEIFGPDRGDVIYDCAGNNKTMGQAIKYARKGSKIILVAVFEGMGEIDLATLNDHQLILDTSMMYREEHYKLAIELTEKGKVKLEPLISKVFDFKDFTKAYEFIDSSPEKSLKVIVNI